MAVSEEQLSGAEYQEPEPSAHIHIEKTRPDVAKAFLGPIDGRPRFRVCSIDVKLIKLEPVQEDVLRYPPVQVQVERDPEATRRYIGMGWHEVKKQDPDDAI